MTTWSYESDHCDWMEGTIKCPKERFNSVIWAQNGVDMNRVNMFYWVCEEHFYRALKAGHVKMTEDEYLVMEVLES